MVARTTHRHTHEAKENDGIKKNRILFYCLVLLFSVFCSLSIRSYMCACVCVWMCVCVVVRSQLKPMSREKVFVRSGEAHYKPVRFEILWETHTFAVSRLHRLVPNFPQNFWYTFLGDWKFFTTQNISSEPKVLHHRRYRIENIEFSGKHENKSF